MEWYWWVLIAIGVVLIGWVKVVVGKRLLAKMAEKKAQQERLLEED